MYANLPNPCPRCGTQIAPGNGGHCLHCLLELGLSLEKETDDKNPTDSEQIGNYRLLRQIGEGGCGVVYEAEQIEPVRRKVALKVIKLGMDTRAVMARFDAEKQALALMDHPNIAKIFDAGATPQGRPYFVMELVNGPKITNYCDVKQLSVEARLELFVQVCLAIQHAHQKGVIHRDIKPSNILVSKDEQGRAIPKIIDFGIAKATTGQMLTDQTYYTAFEQFIGTPAYMSPEQAGFGAIDIDTRSDVYSLGALLYELLTGYPPFTISELRGCALDEVVRFVREHQPARPSTRVTTLQPPMQQASAQFRKTTVNQLSKSLSSSLDWVTMKALEKDRTRRYATAISFAEDIRRYLGRLPVAARPPSLPYQVGLIVRRHRPMLFLLLVSLLLGIGVGIYETCAYRQELLGSSSAIGQIVADNTAAAVAFQRSDEVTQMIGSLRAITQVSDVAVYDTHGDFFAGYPKNIAKTSLPRVPITAEHRFGFSKLRLSIPIIRHHDLLGAVVMRFKVDPVPQNVLLLFLLICLIPTAYVGYHLLKSSPSGAS